MGFFLLAVIYVIQCTYLSSYPDGRTESNEVDVAADVEVADRDGTDGIVTQQRVVRVARAITHPPVDGRAICALYIAGVNAGEVVGYAPCTRVTNE